MHRSHDELSPHDSVVHVYASQCTTKSDVRVMIPKRNNEIRRARLGGTRRRARFSVARGEAESTRPGQCLRNCNRPGFSSFIGATFLVGVSFPFLLAPTRRPVRGRAVSCGHHGERQRDSNGRAITARLQECAGSRVRRGLVAARVLVELRSKGARPAQVGRSLLPTTSIASRLPTPGRSSFRAIPDEDSTQEIQRRLRSIRLPPRDLRNRCATSWHGNHGLD